MDIDDLSAAGVVYVGHWLAATITRDGSATEADLATAIEHAARRPGSTKADLEFIRDLGDG